MIIQILLVFISVFYDTFIQNNDSFAGGKKSDVLAALLVDSGVIVSPPPLPHHY